MGEFVELKLQTGLISPHRPKLSIYRTVRGLVGSAPDLFAVNDDWAKTRTESGMVTAKTELETPRGLFEIHTDEPVGDIAGDTQRLIHIINRGSIIYKLLAQSGNSAARNFGLTKSKFESRSQGLPFDGGDFFDIANDGTKTEIHAYFPGIAEDEQAFGLFTNAAVRFPHNMQHSPTLLDVMNHTADVQPVTSVRTASQSLAGIAMYAINQN